MIRNLPLNKMASNKVIFKLKEDKPLPSPQLAIIFNQTILNSHYFQSDYLKSFSLNPNSSPSFSWKSDDREVGCQKTVNPICTNPMLQVACITNIWDTHSHCMREELVAIVKSQYMQQ